MQIESPPIEKHHVYPIICGGLPLDGVRQSLGERPRSLALKTEG